MSPTAIHRVSVEAPARLHMGFLDPGGALGRKFGSIGVGINEIATRLTITRSNRLSITGPDTERATRIVEQLSHGLEHSFKDSIRIEEVITPHAGLGSGTQMALALGTGLTRLHGINITPRKIAEMIQRGARSGVGIAVFEEGGLVVDAGRGTQTGTPPLISRLVTPEPWRILIVLDHRGQGLHGQDELSAFRELPRFSQTEAARLCHLLLMRGLPAVAEGDLNGFASVITELQRTVGDYFAPAQGGERFTSSDVEAAVDFLAQRGAVGIGQSSWGPTGFCMVDDAISAERLIEAGRERFAERPHLEFRSASIRASGAKITLHSGQGIDSIDPSSDATPVNLKTALNAPISSPGSHRTL